MFTPSRGQHDDMPEEAKQELLSRWETKKSVPGWLAVNAVLRYIREMTAKLTW